MYFAANFHTHSKVKSLPYTFPNFVKFVEATIELYKSLRVLPESSHDVLDDLVKECRDELNRVEKRIECFSVSELTPQQKVVHERLLSEREKQEDVKEDFKEKIQAAIFKSKKSSGLGEAAKRIQQWKMWYDDEKEDELKNRLKREREALYINEGFSSSSSSSTTPTNFLEEWRRVIMNSYDEKINGAMVKIEWWYTEFMPRLLKACSVGKEAEAEFKRDGGGTIDPDSWFKKARSELERFGRDVIDAFESNVDLKIKTRLMQAWRLTRHYLNGVQKQREREVNTSHRTSGCLTQYVAFLDVYCKNRSFVQNAEMRLSFPYFIGNTSWLFKHTVAEIACSSTPEQSKVIIQNFKTYFPLFATMYCCPYCRGHLNQFVVRTRETQMYPIEYAILGWKGEAMDASKSEGRLEISLQDKLDTIVDGTSLRLFVWKLHNAVNSSIARTESWFHKDKDAIVTSRFYPNIDAELCRSTRGVVSSRRIESLVSILKVAVRLNALRKELHVAPNIEEVREVVRTAQILVERLNKIITESGWLQRVYHFTPGALLDPPPVTLDEDKARAAREEDFTLN